MTQEQQPSGGRALDGEMLGQLREFAERATPGPWRWDEGGDMVSDAAGDSDDMTTYYEPEWHKAPPTTIIKTDSGYYPPRDNDGAFIAAFNPTVCLQLLDMIQSLTSRDASSL